ncbi:hypothetical protein ACPPVQ_20020 [Diaminobutyricibacter sp. McL0618]|uniref:hypothetical protein n=1 Tax=Leifsonia sp. McL0618 TaxID=3415677 RepID=UPI003CEE0D55
MTSDNTPSGRPGESADDYPHGIPSVGEPERFVPGKATDAGRGEGAEPPPADFDPAEHPSNPDLVADDTQDLRTGRD